jgi:hypothetical protein
LKRRSEIFEGDTITTEQGARCQIRFSDGSLLGLPEASQFRVDEYEFGASDQDKEKAIYSLLKGGMRTITGAIGKKKPDNYRVNTPVATIGIRGTAYHAFLHRLPSGEIQLYGGVKHGMITIDNSAGSSLFAVNQNFRVLSVSEQAELLMRLPDFYPLQDEEDPAADDDTSSEDHGSDDSNVTENQLTDDKTSHTINNPVTPAVTMQLSNPTLTAPVHTTEDPTTATPMTNQLAPAGSMVGIAFVGMDTEGIVAKTGTVFNQPPSAVYLDSVNGVGNVPIGISTYDTSCNPCSFVPGTATLVDHGGDATIGINWGRWEGDFIVMENGQLIQAAGSFHYIYTPNLTPLSVIQARTGSTSYALSAGNATAPTDQNGTVGVLSSFNIAVDFDNQQIINANLSGSVGSISFSANNSTSVAITDAMNPNKGINIDDTSAGLSGRIDMQFVGYNAEGIAASYGLHDTNLPSQNAITGTALLNDIGPAF